MYIYMYIKITYDEVYIYIYIYIYYIYMDAYMLLSLKNLCQDLNFTKCFL